jgi:hypothetical protein
MSPQRDPMGEAIWDPSPGLRDQLTSEYGGVPRRRSTGWPSRRSTSSFGST